MRKKLLITLVVPTLLFLSYCNLNNTSERSVKEKEQQVTTSQEIVNLTRSSYQKVVPPPKGVYHSAYPDFGNSEDQVTLKSITDFENLVGKRIAWAYFSDNWIDGIKFPKASVQIIQSLHVIPFIRIMPRSSFNEYRQDPIYALQRIIDGDFDDNLKRWAQEAKGSGIPLMLEFGTEVNGDWFPWSGKYNGAGKIGGYGDPDLPDGPERFRDAYRHIIDIFRKEGVKNVTWVYHVNSFSKPAEPWNNISSYYPGDDYIDWIGVSIYGPTEPGEKWQTFTEVLNSSYREISAIGPKKPIAVLEFGVVDDPEIGNKSLWIQTALQSIKSGKYPHIHAISYWHENWKNDDGSISNLRLDSSSKALEAYRKEIASSFFVTKVEIAHK
jgi:hypothetical protein